MVEMVKSFIKEEDGLSTVEIVVIIAVLVGLAFVFKGKVFDVVDKVFNGIDNKVEDATEY